MLRSPLVLGESLEKRKLIREVMTNKKAWKERL